MDKQQIRSHFEERALDLGSNEWSVRELELDYICETIAVQHEEDVASLVAVRDMYAIEIEGLQAQVAQVAVMATAITDVLERRGRGDSWLGETLRAALSAAPKVVWHGMAKTRFNVHGTPVFFLPGDAKVVSGHVVFIQASSVEEFENIRSDGHVDVFVVEYPPKGEQAPDTVQCSRRPEQPQESEQGYKLARGVLPWDESGERPEDVIARLRGRPTESEQKS